MPENDVYKVTDGVYASLCVCVCLCSMYEVCVCLQCVRVRATGPHLNDKIGGLSFPKDSYVLFYKKDSFVLLGVGNLK